ncbi:hypothetical protein K435DRAFT_603684, partial [Dendrothele bispora CBS 962.96]
TKETYAAGLLRFHQYCDHFRISEDLRMPADKTLVAGFIGFYMGKVSGSTVNNWLSGLKLWHDLKGAPWCSDEHWIQMARRSAHKEGAHLKRPLRSPVTYRHLLILRRYLDFSILFHCAVWAVAVITFFACRRLGELTIPSHSKFDIKFHASRATKFKIWTEDGVTCMSFWIPWTKSTRELGTVVTFVARYHLDPEICPVQAVKTHLEVNDKVSDHFSLFAYIDKDGKPKHMVKNDFLQLCFDIWEKEQMRDVLGHSFRIGGAVFLLLAGVPPEMVAKIGGWTSLAFLVYWRRIDEIAAKGIVNAFQKAELEKVRTILDNFRKQNGLS